MLFILCEDSGSGYQFWKTVGDVFICAKGGACEVITSRGYENMQTTLDILFTTGKNTECGHTPKQSDSLLLTVDNVAGVKVGKREKIDVGLKIKKIRDRASNWFVKNEMAQSRLCWTSYFCFEELLLSFEDLPRYCGDSTSALALLCDEVRKRIMLKEDYWTCDEPVTVPKYLEYTGKGTRRTREKFIAYLLQEYTTQTPKLNWFDVKKRYLGGCWKYPCGSVVGEEEVAIPPELCDKCVFGGTMSTVIQKLETLDDKSMLTHEPVKLRDLIDYAR